jgi:hypothetical protein
LPRIEEEIETDGRTPVTVSMAPACNKIFNIGAAIDCTNQESKKEEKEEKKGGKKKRYAVCKIYNIMARLCNNDISSILQDYSLLWFDVLTFHSMPWQGCLVCSSSFRIHQINYNRKIFFW